MSPPLINGNKIWHGPLDQFIFHLMKSINRKTLFWARTFRSDAHEVNDNGKVPFVALSLPILRSVTKSQCQSEILTKRKVTMRKQKLNGKLLFAALFILHCCKKRKEKNIKGNKNEMTNKLLCCAQPPSLQKKEKQTKQTKKETKSILANFLLWLCLAFISAKKKTNKKRKPKKHRRQQRAEWQTTCRDLVRPPSLHDNNLLRSVTKGQCQ